MSVLPPGKTPRVQRSYFTQVQLAEPVSLLGSLRGAWITPRLLHHRKAPAQRGYNSLEAHSEGQGSPPASTPIIYERDERGGWGFRGSEEEFRFSWRRQSNGCANAGI